MSTFAKGNILLIGVDVAHNRFFCSTVPELLGPLFVDTKTHLSFGVNFGSGQISIHACSTFAAMAQRLGRRERTFWHTDHRWTTVRHPSRRTEPPDAQYARLGNVALAIPTYMI